MTGGLTWSVLLQELQDVHMHIIGGVHDLVDERLHDELYVCQIWMTFEHVDRGLHGPLHW